MENQNPIRIRRLRSLVGAAAVFGLALFAGNVSAQEMSGSESLSNLFAPSNPASVGVGGRIVREIERQTEAEMERPLHVHTLWESRYVAEGRDSLDGEPLLSASSDFSFGPLTFAPWYAFGPESDYSELNLSFVAGTDLGENLEIYASYTHLRFLR